MERIEITQFNNNQIEESLFKNVQFFAAAAAGAMGEPGAIIFVNSDGKVFHGNHVYGDIDLDKLAGTFPMLQDYKMGKDPKGWHFIYLGMGNQLLVRNDVYEKFWRTICASAGPDEIDEVYLYKKWLDTALKIVKANLPTEA